MEEIKIVDNYIDDREFRNYISTMFYKHGYYPIDIDDERIADEDISNDNDLIVMKEGKKYTVQTYLNTKIGDKQIKEAVKDLDEEGLAHGLIVTNFYVSKAVKEKAAKENITILDRSEFEDGIYD